MNINTRTILRLRDALLAGGELQPADDDAELPPCPGSRAALERVQPFVETMYLVMVADGAVLDSEQAAIRGALKVLTRGLLDQTALDSLLSQCAEQAATFGVQARLQMIGQHICADRQDRETAFTLAAAVAMADNAIADAESDLISAIGEWYGVSTRRQDQLLQQFDDDGT